MKRVFSARHDAVSRESTDMCDRTYSRTYKMVLLFLMYIVQKVFLCFSCALLPMLMRRQGVSLGAIGFIAWVYSPWCLKFLYAPIVDRFHSDRLGRRKSWIAPLLIVSVATLPALVILPPDRNLKTLLAAVFVLNLVFATTDIAVDGYATDILSPGERPWGNTIQMMGYMLAYMIGAGVFLIVYQQRGWQTTLLTIAVLQTVLVVPILLHREIPPVSPEDGERIAGACGRRCPTVWSFMMQPRTLWFFLFSSLILVFDRGGSYLRLPLFADMGLDPAGLGRLNIWIGSPMSVLGSVLGGVLIKRLGTRRVFWLGCLGSAGLNFFSAAIARNLKLDLVSIAILIGADKLMVGIIFIVVFCLIMEFSVGSQSATRYAVLSSLPHLVGLALVPAIGKLCDVVGYSHLYAGLGCFGVLTLFAGDFLLRRRLGVAERQNEEGKG